MALSLRRPCRCGHNKDQHEHYRRGTDCSGCDCVAFHGQLEVTFRLGRQRPPVIDVVVPDEVPDATQPYVRPTHSAGLTAQAANLPEPRPALHVVPPTPAEKPSLRKQSAG